MQTPKSEYSFLAINYILKTNIPLEGDLKLIIFCRFSAPKPLVHCFMFVLKSSYLDSGKKNTYLCFHSSTYSVEMFNYAAVRRAGLQLCS